MSPPDDPEPPTEADVEILALIQADEDDEAVYGWMAEESDILKLNHQRWV